MFCYPRLACNGRWTNPTIVSHIACSRPNHSQQLSLSLNLYKYPHVEYPIYPEFTLHKCSEALGIALLLQLPQMGIRLPEMVVHAKKSIRLMRSSSSISDQTNKGCVPKGHFAVYVGVDEKKRFVVPISYLKHPLFQDLLSRAEEEFGFDHPSGGLTIPCNEDDFVHITSHLR